MRSTRWETFAVALSGLLGGASTCWPGALKGSWPVSLEAYSARGSNAIPPLPTSPCTLPLYGHRHDGTSPLEQRAHPEPRRGRRGDRFRRPHPGHRRGPGRRGDHHRRGAPDERRRREVRPGRGRRGRQGPRRGPQADHRAGRAGHRRRPRDQQLPRRPLRDGLKSLQLAFREASSSRTRRARARARSSPGRSTPEPPDTAVPPRIPGPRGHLRVQRRWSGSPGSSAPAGSTARLRPRSSRTRSTGSAATARPTRCAAACTPAWSSAGSNTTASSPSPSW